MGVVDLHLHSKASDGEATPEDVVHRAAARHLTAIALTDHDTLDGIPPAVAAGANLRIRVVAGCEFSVAAWWGELHLLAFFLPADHEQLQAFMAGQRQARADRAVAIVERLAELGAPLAIESVREHASRAPIGRPHIARALTAAGRVGSVGEAFDRFLADGAPAYVPKVLPGVEKVTAMVRDLGGVTSAAHLKHRGDRETVRRLRKFGVDAVEVIHPAHDGQTTSRLNALASDFGMLRTGGSDWHGPTDSGRPRAEIGALKTPAEWLDRLEELHRQRRSDTVKSP